MKIEREETVLSSNDDPLICFRLIPDTEEERNLLLEMVRAMKGKESHILGTGKKGCLEVWTR